MFYFEMYGKLTVLVTYFLVIGLILLSLVIFYSVRKYEKPAARSPEEAEHAEPGVPLVLKGLYIGIAIYILAATVWVAVSGVKIG
jgi:hypothetical protein